VDWFRQNAAPVDQAELCADELVVGGGVGWSFSSAAAAWLYGRQRRRRRRQTE